MHSTTLSPSPSLLLRGSCTRTSCLACHGTSPSSSPPVCHIHSQTSFAAIREAAMLVKINTLNARSYIVLTWSISSVQLFKGLVLCKVFFQQPLKVSAARQWTPQKWEKFILDFFWKVELNQPWWTLIPLTQGQISSFLDIQFQIWK